MRNLPICISLFLKLGSIVPRVLKIGFPDSEFLSWRRPRHRRERGENKSIIRDTIAIVFATSVSESRSCRGPAAAGVSPSRRRGRRPCQSLPFAVVRCGLFLAIHDHSRSSLCSCPSFYIHLDHRT